MSGNIIQIGLWRDWRTDGVLNHRLTLNTSQSNALIAAIGIWVGTFISGWVWSFLVYLVHRKRASLPHDGVRAQHQIVWLNDKDPLTALLDNLKILSSNLSPQTSTPSDPNLSTRRRDIILRNLLAVALPFLVWAGFIVAAVFAPAVADANGNLILQGDQGRCGILQYPSSQTTILNETSPYSSKILKDTLSARSYAETCYSGTLLLSRPSTCTLYTLPTLPYFNISLPTCPFSPDPAQKFAQSPCAAPPADSHNSSLLVHSDLLDSSIHLGINAPPEERILFQKNVTCSPLSLTNRSHPTSLLGTISNVTYRAYYFGATNVSSAIGDTYTYFTNPSSDMDHVPYTIDAFYSDQHSDRGAWRPDYPFNTTAGDVSLFFLAANSIIYNKPVYDPFFLSNSFADEVPTGPATAGMPIKYYKPYLSVQVMGCVDLYRLCRYAASSASTKDVICTPNSGRSLLRTAKGYLPQNPAQNVTLSRIYDMINNTDTYSSVYGLGSRALRASEVVINLIAQDIPSNQWQIEVASWFQTSLSKMQAYAVEYTKHNIIDGDAFSRPVFLPGVASDQAWITQCNNQRVGSVTGYQTFSVFGLFFMLAFGLLSFLLSEIAKWTKAFNGLLRAIGLGRFASPASQAAFARRFNNKFTLADAAMRDGHLLQDLQPGREMPVYPVGFGMPRPRLDGNHVTFAPDTAQTTTVLATGNQGNVQGTSTRLTNTTTPASSSSQNALLPAATSAADTATTTSSPTSAPGASWTHSSRHVATQNSVHSGHDQSPTGDDGMSDTSVVNTSVSADDQTSAPFHPPPTVSNPVPGSEAQLNHISEPSDSLDATVPQSAGVTDAAPPNPDSSSGT